MNKYFDKDEIVNYESSVLPLDSKFKYELYTSLPMSEEELTQTKNKYDVKYNTWKGALQHIAG